MYRAAGGYFVTACYSDGARDRGEGGGGEGGGGEGSGEGATRAAGATRAVGARGLRRGRLLPPIDDLFLAARNRLVASATQPTALVVLAGVPRHGSVALWGRGGGTVGQGPNSSLLARANSKKTASSTGAPPGQRPACSAGSARTPGQRYGGHLYYT